MSSSDCCFLTCIQVSQEAGQLVWYSHLFQNFPQFIVIHTVKGFGTVNKAEIGVFLELSCFLDNPVDVGNLISGSSPFSKTSLSIWKFIVHILLKPGDLKASLGLSSKESAYNAGKTRDHKFSPWVGKIFWRWKWQPTLVFLPGKSHAQRNLVGYSPWVCKSQI